MANSERKRKRRKNKRDNRKLLPGEEVEVLYCDEGLNGSWHMGVVVDCGERSRLIEYINLLSEDNCSKLKESIPVSAAIEGLLKRTLRNHRGQIRPSPPHYGIQQSEIKYGLCVDALVDDAWWEGVVFDRDEGSAERLVFFPDQGDQQMVTVDRLRVTQDWNEVLGDWKPRGKWLLLQVLQPFEHEDTLPVSIREIWYDLRTTAAFSDKIGVWTFGSRSIWHSLVSELIQELQSVAHGLIATKQLIDVPMSYSVVDSPILQKDGAGVNTGLAVAVNNFQCSKLRTPDDRSLSDSSPSTKCANGNCSYVTTENKIAEASRGAVYGKEALLLSGLNEPQGLCLHEISNFIYENHNNVAPRSPYLRKRSNVACQMAKSDIFAARRSDDGDCGSKNYVLPDGKHSNSFIKACGACKETEFQKTMNCCGANNHLICKDHGAEANSNLAQRDNKADGSTNLRAAESWKPFYLEAAYHPEAIEVCVNHSEDGEHQLKETEVSDDNLANVRLRAKKHLLALGWKIETRTRREDKTSLRVRFLSPEGNSYYSLHQACCGLLKEHQKKDKKCRSDKHTDGVCLCSNIYELLPAKFHPEPAYLQQDCAVKRSKREREDSSIAVGLCASNEYAKSNRIHSEKFRPFSKTVDSGIIEEISSDVFKENWRGNTNHAMSWKEKWVSNASERELPVYNDIKPVYLPEAVLKYKNYMDSRGKGKQDADVNLMRLNARKHLMFMGWKFRIKKQKSKGELFITSPSGKPFRSLYSACDGYLEEENIKNSSARVSLKGAESGSIILSDFSEFRELGLCKLHLKGHGKSKKRKMTSHFSSFSFAALGDRLLKQPPGRSSIFEKSKKRKACQARIRQGHKLGSRFSPHVARSSKRSRQIVVKTPSHHVARTVLSLLIDNDMILPRQKVHYIRRRDGHVMMEGRITRDGIRCKCCKMVYSLTNFEAHAGSNNRRPAANIFLQDGRSLLQCQMQMIHHKKPKSFQRPRLKSDYSLYKSDTICSVCHDGGSLVLCDHCPSSFHLGCVGLEDVPKGKWFCSSCRCGICGQSEFNSDTEQFTEKTVLNCDQCEREYHVGCMRKRGLTRLSSCPVGNWFCSKKCSKIFFHLRKLLGKSKPTAMEGLSWTILRSGRENDVDYEQFDAETMAEHDSKLCVALNVLHECFVTMIEPRTQSDFVADLLFNKESELNRLNFYGFYTMLLERGDELISVATFRVYGEKVAEMPLVGTRIKYRRQGMCRLLMNEIEKLLSALGVERLVLPAVPQLLQTWTTSFGFTKMSSSDRLYFSEYTLLNFQDTTMCQKLLRTAPTVSEKPKGDSKELMDRASRSIEKVDSENYSIVSEVVEMEPVKTVPSLGVETCPLPGEADHIEQISYQTDAAHSPSVSACIDPVGQTVQKTGMNGLTSINIAPGKCRDSSVSVEMSPTVVVRPSTILNFKFFRKCYERVGRSGTIRGHLFKSINDRVASTFKYFYRRRISANKQTLFPRNDLASC